MWAFDVKNLRTKVLEDWKAGRPTLVVITLPQSVSYCLFLLTHCVRDHWDPRRVASSFVPYGDILRLIRCRFHLPSADLLEVEVSMCHPLRHKRVELRSVAVGISLAWFGTSDRLFPRGSRSWGKKLGKKAINISRIFFFFFLCIFCFKSHCGLRFLCEAQCPKHRGRIRIILSTTGWVHYTPLFCAYWGLSSLLCGHRPAPLPGSSSFVLAADRSSFNRFEVCTQRTPVYQFAPFISK